MPAKHLQQRMLSISRLFLKEAIEKGMVSRVIDDTDDFLENYSSNSLFCIEEGTVLQRQGKESSSVQYEHFYSKGSVIGLFPDQSFLHKDCTLIPITKVKIYQIRPEILNIIHSEHKHTLLLTTLEHDLFWKSARVKLLTLKAEHRVYYVLKLIRMFRQAYYSEQPFDIPKFFTHNILAGLACISRTRVSYIMSDLKKNKIIGLDKKGNLLILKPEFLENELSR